MRMTPERIAELREQSQAVSAEYRKAMHECLDAIEALRAERDAAEAQCADHQRGENELGLRCEALERELERWRHGKQIEGDYVCEATLERDRYRAALEQISGLLGDGEHTVFDAAEIAREALGGKP
jgi:uncharacterized coiled-coil DUF342 family protein